MVTNTMGTTPGPMWKKFLIFGGVAVVALLISLPFLQLLNIQIAHGVIGWFQGTILSKLAVSFEVAGILACLGLFAVAQYFGNHVPLLYKFLFTGTMKATYMVGAIMYVVLGVAQQFGFASNYDYRTGISQRVICFESAGKIFIDATESGRKFEARTGAPCYPLTPNWQGWYDENVVEGKFTPKFKKEDLCRADFMLGDAAGKPRYAYDLNEGQIFLFPIVNSAHDLPKSPFTMRAPILLTLSEKDRLCK